MRLPLTGSVFRTVAPVQFFQGFPQTLLEGSDFQVSAEQPPEKSEPQEPVRGLQAGMWIRGWGAPGAARTGGFH